MPPDATNTIDKFSNAPSLHNTTMDRVATSQHRKVLQEPKLTSKELQRPKASTYLLNVKHSVSSAGFEEFTSALKSFKAKKTPFKQLMSVISRLFEKSEKGLELLEGFQDFVPRKHIADYQQLMEAKRSTKRSV
jgi:hypothetical protein